MDTISKLVDVIEAMGLISIFECTENNGHYTSADTVDGTLVDIYFNEDFDSWVASFVGEGIQYLHEFDLETILINLGKL